MFLTLLKRLTIDLILDLYFALKHRGRYYPRPPLYPNSHSLKKYPFPDHPTTRVTSFETPDGLEYIFPFYEDVLKKDGWSLESESWGRGYMRFYYHRPHFYFFGKAPRPPTFHSHERPWYSLEIRVQPLETGRRVEIHHTVRSPRGWRDDTF
ncbi:MAG: hypothetical protein J0I20_07610 [Chloroflexi bacterium]|nr:hypothetical protein [Chloroflexota bacterium]